jgi:hypothetical protein
MAGRNKAGQDAAIEAAAKNITVAADRAALTDKELAQAVLAGTLRPRAGEVRRLAEAVLWKDAPKPPKKKGKAKKAKSGKLAKIPRQKK